METPEDLAEYIADLANIYNYHRGEHHDKCQCRICFGLEMAKRIRQSVEAEKLMTYSTKAAKINVEK